jgi:ubiquinone/menaquinone biosynthesis C-methylase UbiE
MNDEEKVTPSMEAEFWNDEGGKRWVSNIERTHALLAPLSEELMDRAIPANGETVLDVGCGGGQTTVRIAECVGNNGRVVGVDVSKMILGVAKQQSGLPANVSFELLNAGTADLGNAIYDLIFSRFGIMFFEDPVAAFTNLHGALVADGRLVAMCWRSPAENPWIARPTAAAQEVIPPESDEETDPRAPGPFAFADPDWVRKILQSAGFSKIALEPIDTKMLFDNMDDAVAYMMRMGPAAAAIDTATDAQRAAIDTAIREAFAEYDTQDGVHAPCAAWIILARASG